MKRRGKEGTSSYSAETLDTVAGSGQMAILSITSSYGEYGDLRPVVLMTNSNIIFFSLLDPNSFVYEIKFKKRERSQPTLEVPLQ